MNTNKLTTKSLTLAIIAAAAFSANAHADSNSANLSVSATVINNCIVTTADLEFGGYDPVNTNSAMELTGTGLVTVTCTVNAQAELAIGLGRNDEGSNPDSPMRRMNDDNGNYINYAVYSDPNHSRIWGGGEQTCVIDAGSGAPREHYVYGIIPGGQNVPAGNYSDMLLATVMF